MRRSLARFLLLPLLLLPFLAPAASAGTLDDVVKRGTVKVGIDLGVPPYGLTDANQKPAGYDVEVRFLEEAAVLEAAIRRSLDEGHAVVKGKWLVDVFAPRTLGGSATPQRCRDEWIAHAVTNTLLGAWVIATGNWGYW